jgi:hypothetical protein
VTFEFWKDYPFYHNYWHYDDPNVQNIMIIYLDDGEIIMGTQYEEHGEIFSVPYKSNTGIMLLNSDKHLHGMIGKVPPNTARKTLYVNWKSCE